MVGTVEILTPRLRMRRHILEDAEPLYENFGKDDAMYKYSGWNPYATLEDAKEATSRIIADYDNPHHYSWAIEHEGRLVGTIGVYDYDVEKNTVEIGMSIERASWGKGFATEALEAVLGYLTKDGGIGLVTAWCAADNIGSWRALEKAGMVRTSVEIDGLQIGEAIYDKLNYEYRGV